MKPTITLDELMNNYFQDKKPTQKQKEIWKDAFKIGYAVKVAQSMIVEKG
jgi:hypothetical protein